MSPNDSHQLKKLKSILLNDVDTTLHQIQEQLAQEQLTPRVEQIIDTKFQELVEEKIVPTIEQYISDLKNDFPEHYKSVVNSMIEQKLLDHANQEINPIKNDVSNLMLNLPKEYNTSINDLVETKISDSQDQIVDVISPKLDLMIKRYVTHQFQKLKESIDTKLNHVKTKFSFKTIFKRAVGVSKGEELLTELDPSILTGIYLVEKSGITIAWASEQGDEKEVVTAMFTAIQHFVEDGFGKSGESLESIKGSGFILLPYKMHSYYFLAFLQGSVSESEKGDYFNKMVDFAAREIPKAANKLNETEREKLSHKLKSAFFNS